jgi:hypothetical protein
MAGNEDDLLNNDDKWCMGKDELAVVCNRNIDSSVAKTGTKYAYPSVVTTLGEMDENEKHLISSHYHFMGKFSGNSLVESVYGEAGPSSKAQQYREFIPVGYSVGRACAHGYKGDTVASVQIGGLRTVLNGEFNVQTGDLIQMYIPDAEEQLFNADGGRRRVNGIKDAKNLFLHNQTNQKPLSEQEKKRRRFYSRGLGIGTGNKKNGKENRIKTGVFSIKPYLESLNDDCLQYYGDKIRVFARAVSCARPFEPVDIMIARQAL